MSAITASKMTELAFFFVLCTLFSWQVDCDVSRDLWTWPEPPDNAITVQNNEGYLIEWGQEATKKWFDDRCSCSQLDLGVESNNQVKFAKLGSVTTEQSIYTYRLKFSSDWLSADDSWHFYLAANGSISWSPLFRVSDGAETISTSSATTLIITDFIATPTRTFTSIRSTLKLTPTGSPTLNSTSSTTSPVLSTSESSSTAATDVTPAPSPKSRTWVAGAVIGPLAGIVLGLALVLFLLRKKKQKMQQDQWNPGYTEGDDLPEHIPGPSPGEGKHHQGDEQAKWDPGYAAGDLPEHLPCTNTSEGMHHQVDKQPPMYQKLLRMGGR